MNLNKSGDSLKFIEMKVVLWVDMKNLLIVVIVKDFLWFKFILNKDYYEDGNYEFIEKSKEIKF